MSGKFAHDLRGSHSFVVPVRIDSLHESKTLRHHYHLLGSVMLIWISCPHCQKHTVIMSWDTVWTMKSGTIKVGVNTKMVVSKEFRNQEDILKIGKNSKNGTSQVFFLLKNHTWPPLKINKLIHESSQILQLEIPHLPSHLDGNNGYLFVFVPPWSFT